MKRIFFILIICAFSSCEKEEINQSDSRSSNELYSKNLRCQPLNENPFTEQSVTFSFACDWYPSYDCFNPTVENFILYEIYDRYFIPQQGLHLAELISSHQIMFDLDEIIDTSDIYPYITASNANIIYKDVVCRIISEINLLGNPGWDRYFGIEIQYLSTDFNLCCGGPEDAHIEVNYQIWKY